MADREVIEFGTVEVIPEAPKPPQDPRVEAAYQEVFAVCAGTRRWTMSVPVRDDDSDMVITAGLKVAEELTAVVEAVRALHPPTADGTSCSVCSQEEEQPEVGYWVPYPCPTVALLPPDRGLSLDEKPGAAS